MYLYSALFVVPHTQGAQAWITQCYLQLHQCLPLPRKRSPDGASPRLRLRIANCSLLLIYLPRKDERLSRPGWQTYSGRFTHISGHPSAAGRAQDRESSPVKDRRSTNCATQPTVASVSHRCLNLCRNELQFCVYSFIHSFPGRPRTLYMYSPDVSSSFWHFASATNLLHSSLSIFVMS